MTFLEYRSKYADKDDLFDGIPEEELENVTVAVFRKGTPLIEAGQFDDRLFIMLEGLADIVEEYTSGLCMTYYKITSGDVIGYYELLTDKPRRRATIRAHTDVVAAYIPKRLVVDWQERYPIFSRRLCIRIINRLYDSNSLMAECSSYSLYRATITYLLFAYGVYLRYTQDETGGSIRIGESRQSIAEFLGADVRSVNRAIEKLKGEGLVSIVRGKVHMNAQQAQRLTVIKNTGVEL